MKKEDYNFDPAPCTQTPTSPGKWGNTGYFGRPSRLVPTFRLSVLVPSATPARDRVAPDRLVRFETLLRDEVPGFTRRQVSGEWFDGSAWIPDDSIEYVVSVRTRAEASRLATELERFVAREFEQELVLLSITAEFSTLFAREDHATGFGSSRLLLIDGPPGAGKTAANEILGGHPGVRVLPKYKTALRPEERGGVDGRSISRATFEDFARRDDFCSYEFCGEGYGFFRNELYSAMREAPLVALVVRDSSLLRRLRGEFPSAAAVLILCDRDVARARVGDTSAARKRLARTVAFWRDYDFTLYSQTLVNHGSKEQFAADIHRLLNLYLPEDVYVPQPAA